MPFHANRGGGDFMLLFILLSSPPAEVTALSDSEDSANETLSGQLQDLFPSPPCRFFRRRPACRAVTPNPVPSPTSAPYKCFTDNWELQTAVSQYLANPRANDSEVALEYGWPIGDWCVSPMYSFNGTFQSQRFFNEDISNWDVSNALDMVYMFSGAGFFNQPLGSWNTSQVRDMDYMFYFATPFNQDISQWNVSKVETMRLMFYQAYSFNQNLCDWGPQLDPQTDVSRMFFASGCPEQGDPNLTLDPPSPMCHVCS